MTTGPRLDALLLTFLTDAAPRLEANQAAMRVQLEGIHRDLARHDERIMALEDAAERTGEHALAETREQLREARAVRTKIVLLILAAVLSIGSGYALARVVHTTPTVQAAPR